MSENDPNGNILAKQALPTGMARLKRREERAFSVDVSLSERAWAGARRCRGKIKVKIPSNSGMKKINDPRTTSSYSMTRTMERSTNKLEPMAAIPTLLDCSQAVRWSGIRSAPKIEIVNAPAAPTAPA